MIAMTNLLSKNGRILLTGLLVAVLGGLGWYLLAPQGAVYEGKGLRFWLNEYEENLLREVHEAANDELAARKEKAEEAIRAIGTNGLPLLLEMIGAHDSVLKIEFTRLIGRANWYRLQPYSAENYRGKTLYAFGFLGETAAPAVPTLIAYMNDADAHVRSHAASALGAIGPLAEEGVPALVKGLTDVDLEVRGKSALSLGFIHRKPDLAVSALIRSLETQQIEVAALAALGYFGKEAKSAVPAILQLLEHADERLREYATQALMEIDPEAAARVRAK